MSYKPSDTQLAILGAGRIGTLHAANLYKLDDVQIKYIYDISQPAAKTLASNCDAVAVTLEDILNDTGLCGALICTDTKSHLDLAEKFIKRNIPVFCEKPIALDLERVELFLRLCKANNGICQVGFQRRFDPNFVQAHNSVITGGIGNIEVLSITSRDPNPADERYIKESPSIFLDMMIHDFDIAQWFIPEVITEVFATGECLTSKIYSKYHDIDTAIAVLKTESGKLITIQNSRSTEYGYDQRIEVKGTKGLISVNNLHNDQVTISSSDGVTRSGYLDFFQERYSAAYQNEMMDFLDVIRNGAVPKVTPYDGYKSLKLALYAEEAFGNKQIKILR